MGRSGREEGGEGGIGRSNKRGRGLLWDYQSIKVGRSEENVGKEWERKGDRR